MKPSRTEKTTVKNAYFVGIKGVGMTALAQVLKGLGVKVCGSDTKEKFFTDKVLRKLGIKYTEGFSAKNLPKRTDLVVSSAAYYQKGKPSKNPEILEAQKRKLTIKTYPEMLGQLFDRFFGVAICGSHGKTTTTALAGHILKSAGLEPTIIIGSESVNLGSNSYLGDIKEKKILIAEADEYREAFLNYRPKIAVITNIDYDHPDYFKNERSYIAAFEKIVSSLPKNGLLIIYGDDKYAKKLIAKAKCKVVTYGEGKNNSVRFSGQKTDGFLQTFDVSFPGHTMDGIELPMIGKHNILNAMAGIILARYFNVPEKDIRCGLVTFRGTRRRMEIIGVKNGAIIIDDYAHHPSEVSATLCGLKHAFPKKKIIAAFQPHTFTRTKQFLGEFAAAFACADKTLIFDVYGSAREKQGTVSSKDIIKKMKNKKNVFYFKKPLDAKNFVSQNLKEDTIFVTMGAGDIWTLGKHLLSQK
jgi:UDP-N-acetylmuramate--alanine ligase